MERDRRLAGADAMRAAACLLVLIHHLVLRIDIKQVDPGEQSAFVIARFGNFGVAIFFVLSGYLLARPFWRALDERRPLPDMKTYAARRAARILPGYWVALTAGFVLSLTLFGHPPTAELAMRYIAGFLLMSQWHWRTFFPVEGNGPLWSIPFEATCYILLPLCMLALHHFSRPLPRFATRLLWLGTIATALVLQWLIVNALQPDDVQRGWQFGMAGGAKEWMPRYNPIGFFAIFALGIFASGVETILPQRKVVLFDILACLAIAGSAAALVSAADGPWEAYGWLGVPYSFPLFPIAIAAALVSLAHALWLGNFLDNRALRFTAKISFGIYIWQDPVISALKVLFPSAFGPIGDNLLYGWLLWSLLAAALVLVVGSLSYIFIERPVLLRAHAVPR
ncbi:acyltransferase family protein [Rhizobium sullae]|uniref:Peptidoglycan/LPS O-acetylase OafA/YrhL n=1 Tax=Rhizobium sullae TaxID=50338 RepID=A0A4R3QAW0_RHISU|nr:acyltransferase [Rhizobium sullae]TCU16592.1 peptidoglycan/LPS O-acetylase OafA/YrhL [Rhizobium sullae]